MQGGWVMSPESLKRGTESCPVPAATWNTVQGAIYGTRKQASDLGLPVSRTLRHVSVDSKLPSLLYFVIAAKTD